MTYYEHIQRMREDLIGKSVRYCGETYKVEDVDEDAFLTIRNEKGSAVVECSQLDTKRNGNPIDRYTFRLVSGDFYEGESVTVETILDGMQYTRKVKNDGWDLYITINNARCYWECDSAEE